jgi:hypothetical protein
MGGGEIKFQFLMKKHPTSNIQHPTPNPLETPGSFDVGCWMLDVGCSAFFPFSPEAQP